MTTVVRASVEEALCVDCPECGVTAPNPCVYLPLKNIDEHAGHSMRVRARMQLTGTPTLRPHNGRFNVAWQRKISRAQAARKKELANAVTQTTASPKVRAIARAHQQWDRQEWLRLTAWLRRWGHIFAAPPNITKETQ